MQCPLYQLIIHYVNVIHFGPCGKVKPLASPPSLTMSELMYKYLPYLVKKFVEQKLCFSFSVRHGTTLHHTSTHTLIDIR